MREKDQTRFLSWFKPTNIFKLSQVEKGIWTGDDSTKLATYAMEASMAVLMDAKLWGVSYTSGRCFNCDICRYRPFVGGYDPNICIIQEA